MSLLLEIKNLKTVVTTDRGIIPLVKEVSFSLNKGEVVGIVGESGSGKSMTALSILRLFPYQPNITVSGEVVYKGVDLMKIRESEMTKFRGKEISMITQEPMTALNPVYTIGHQVMEMARLRTANKSESKNAALEMLKLVGIPSPQDMFDKYPHEYSGGMRQRVMIAMALSAEPSLMIADEPTTALDVTIQAQILSLIRDLREKFKMALVIITHDLGIIAETVDRVIIMYAGRIVEEGDVSDIYDSPLHPYTASLLKCIPRLDISVDELNVIKGEPPDPHQDENGCSFSPRCLLAVPHCHNNQPELRELPGNRKSSCFRHRDFLKENLHLQLAKLFK